jgi:hypothetical protein
VRLVRHQAGHAVPGREIGRQQQQVGEPIGAPVEFVEVVAHARGDVVERFHAGAELGALGQHLSCVGQHRGSNGFSTVVVAIIYRNSSKRTF